LNGQIAKALVVLTVLAGCSQPTSTTAPALPTATPIPSPPTATATPHPAPTPTPASLSLLTSTITNAPPAIDGTLSPGEWDGARQVELPGGGQLLFLHDGDYLYLGIRAAANPLGSLCLDRGDEVAILHSSAALGTAIYQEDDQGWQRTKDFSWDCRSTDDSPFAQRQRDEFLQREGWVANNGRTGTPEELEFQIAVPEGEDSLRLAVTYLQAPDYGSVIWWPPELDDDCRNIQLLRGPVPESLQFSPGTWATVITTRREK
jgi:hypothetical protein